MIVMYVNMQEILSTLWKILILVAIVLWAISYLLVGFSNPGIVISTVHDIIRLLTKTFTSKKEVLKR